MIHFHRNVNHLATGLTIALAVVLVASSPASARGPFDNFSGTWTGRGNITLTDGSLQPVRCNISYAVAYEQNSVGINVSCASDDYKFNVISQVTAQDRVLTGTWKETTRNAEGTVTGRIPGKGQIQASLEGTGFGIQFSASARGNRQAATVRSQGTDLESIQINLQRTGAALQTESE